MALANIEQMPMGGFDPQLEESGSTAGQLGQLTATELTKFKQTANLSIEKMANLSNMGEMSATAMVGWNAVPGGFEPLPQTIGGRKIAYKLSRFEGGLNLN